MAAEAILRSLSGFLPLSDAPQRGFLALENSACQVTGGGRLERLPVADDLDLRDALFVGVAHHERETEGVDLRLPSRGPCRPGE